MDLNLSKIGISYHWSESKYILPESCAFYKIHKKCAKTLIWHIIQVKSDRYLTSFNFFWVMLFLTISFSWGTFESYDPSEKPTGSTDRISVEVPGLSSSPCPLTSGDSKHQTLLSQELRALSANQEQVWVQTLGVCPRLKMFIIWIRIIRSVLIHCGV